MKTDLPTLLTAIRNFIETHKGLDPSSVEVDTQLFQEGYLDSFSMVALIDKLSDELSLQLSPGDLIPDDFASVRSLEQRLQEL